MIAGLRADLHINDCQFEAVTAKACVRPPIEGGHYFSITNTVFHDITVSGGGGFSPNGIVWSDTTGNQIHGSIVGCYFVNIPAGLLVNMGGGGEQSVVAVGNEIEDVAAGANNEGIWVHNQVDEVHVAGDHSSVSEAGIDTTAIHDDTAAEISAITEKTAPVAADLLVIEDSAASNAKKRLQVGNLPGARMAIPGFVRSNLAASLTDDQLERYDGTASGHQESIVVPYAGSAVAISVASNEARSAGTATFEVFINDVASGLTAVLDATDTQYAFGTQAVGTDALAAGDRVDVHVTTDGTWAPTTADVEATIFVAVTDILP